MRSREWIELAAGAAAYVLGMFGGFLTGFAPPHHPWLPDSNFAVGFGSFLVAVGFLVIVAVIRLLGRRARPQLWLAIAGVLLVIFVWTGFAYHDFRQRQTFVLEDSTYIAGDVLTSRAQNFAEFFQDRNGRFPTKEELLRGFESDAAQVWTEASILSVQRRMERRFLVALIAISACLFFLVEGVLPLLPKGPD